MSAGDVSFDGTGFPGRGLAEDHPSVFAIAPPDAAHPMDTLVRNNQGIWRCEWWSDQSKGPKWNVHVRPKDDTRSQIPLTLVRTIM